MNTDELRKLLEEYGNKKYSKQITEDVWQINPAFNRAVELLWPLVEALESIRNSKGLMFAECSDSDFILGVADKALTDLEQKLKGES